MSTRKWHILISTIIFLIGIIILSFAEKRIYPDVNIIWIALRDLGLAFLVGAVPYVLFQWIMSETEKDTIKYLGTKRDTGPKLDGLISGAKERIDIIGLTLNDLFSGSVTPSLLFDKIRRGCNIRLFVLDPTSIVLNLRAADENITPEILRSSIVEKADKKWRELSQLLANKSSEHQNISGRLELLFYESLPYFTLFRTDGIMIFGLYNRNVSCNTSVAFDISTNEDLFKKFEEDLNWLAGSSLIKLKAIHFRGGSGSIFETIYS